MKYRCKKCGELYDELPFECDYDSETEFEETQICGNCGEYKVLFGNYCKDCIESSFTEKIGTEYLSYLDKKLKSWGIEPFFCDEYSYFSKIENKGNKKENFLWEYCSRELEPLGEFIFDINGKQVE